MKAHDAIFVLGANAVEKQHMEMDRAAFGFRFSADRNAGPTEALNQGDGTGVGCAFVEPGFLDQVGGQRAVDDL